MTLLDENLWGCVVLLYLVNTGLKAQCLNIAPGLYFLVETLQPIRDKLIVNGEEVLGKKRGLIVKGLIRHKLVAPHCISFTWSEIVAADGQCIIPNAYKCLRKPLFTSALGVQGLLFSKAGTVLLGGYDDRHENFHTKLEELNDLVIKHGFHALPMPRCPEWRCAGSKRKSGVPPNEQWTPKKKARVAKKRAQRQIRETERAHFERTGLQMAESKSTAASARSQGIHHKSKQVLRSFIDVSTAVFTPMWRSVLGKDTGVISDISYKRQRSARMRREAEAPLSWIRPYQRLLNERSISSLGIGPAGGLVHPSLKDTGGDALGAGLSIHRVIYTDLKLLLMWNVCEAVAMYCDISDYIINEATGTSRAKMLYKIAFDTTQTSGRDMFMMGVIPHTFPHTSSIQSADNVLVLCLARIAENVDVIKGAVPGLAETVRELQSDGIAIDFGGDVLRVGVEIHVAADLKALWLAMQLPNFACPRCHAVGWKDYQKTTEDFQKRQLEDMLGVPAQNIHLCALHASLRITERLLKNAVTNAYGVSAQKRDLRRINALKRFLVRTRCCAISRYRLLRLKEASL